VKQVYCWCCAQAIRSRDDLYVVSHWGMTVRPYCGACYLKREKSFSHHFRTGSIPLNTRYSKYLILLLLGLAVVNTVTISAFPDSHADLILLWMAVIWSASLRMVSYFGFERHVATETI